ncbi:centrosomal protein of 152 kDa isoform X2 [Genypterus blacodes]|uniref:centrosomal protein of 152 kDa isoform X2 n=1 Tax=Genypterus blacodes TaxID=154954 RepID=UPI003F762FCF
MSIDFDSAALQTQHDEEEYDQEDYAREQELHKLLTDLPDDMLEDSRDSSPELEESTCNNKNTGNSPQSTWTQPWSDQPRPTSHKQDFGVAYDEGAHHHARAYEDGSVPSNGHGSHPLPHTWKQHEQDHHFNQGDYTYTSVATEQSTQANDFSIDEYESNPPMDYSGEREPDGEHSNSRNHFQNGSGERGVDQYKASYNPHQPKMFNSQAPHQEAQFDSLQREFLDSAQKTADKEQLAQVQILNKAQQRQIEDLERKQEDSRRTLRYIEHQFAIVKDEKEGLAGSLKESTRMIEEAKQREFQMQNKLKSLEQQVGVLNERNQENMKKQMVGEAAVDSMKQQMLELCRSDTLSRTREQHDRDLTVIREQHEAAVLLLQQKLDSTSQALAEQADAGRRLQEQVKQLECQREEEQLDRARVVNALTQHLEESQQQCAKLLQTGSVQEMSQVQIKLQQAQSAKALSENMNKALQEDLTDLKEQITLYESAVKHGLISLDPSSDLEIQMSESCVDLGLKTSNWKNGILHSTALANLSEAKLQKDESSRQMRVEMQRCLANLKGKRLKIGQLQEDLQHCQARADELQSQLDEAQLSSSAREMSQVKHPDVTGVPQKEIVRLQEGNQRLQEQVELLEEKNKELKQNEEKLKFANLELCTKMREMIQELDQEKQEAAQRSERVHQQYRDDVVNRVKTELKMEHSAQVDRLTSQHQQQIQQLQTLLSEANDKMAAVQECYISVCNEKNTFEQVKEESGTVVEKLRAELEAQHQASVEQLKALWIQEKQTEIQQQGNSQVASAKAVWKEELQEMERTWEQKLEEAKRRKHPETAELTCQTDEGEISRGAITAEELDSRLQAQKQQLQSEADKVKRKAVEEARKQAQRELHQKHLEDMAKQVEGAVTRAYSRWIEDLTSLPQHQTIMQTEKAKWEELQEEHTQQRVSQALKEAKEQWSERHKNQLEGQRTEAQRAEDLQEEVAALQSQLEQLRGEQTTLLKAELAGARAAWTRDKQQEISIVQVRCEQAYRTKLEQALQRAREDADLQRKELLLQAEGQLLQAREEARRRQSAEKEQAQRQQMRVELLAELQAALAEVQAQLLKDSRSDQRDTEASIRARGAATEGSITHIIHLFCKDMINKAVSQAKKEWKRISEERLSSVLKQTLEQHKRDMDEVQNTWSQRTEQGRCRKECVAGVAKLQRKNQELQRHLEKACRQLQHSVGEHKAGLRHLKGEHESSVQKLKEEHLQQLEEVKRSTESTGSSQQNPPLCLKEMKQQYQTAVDKIRGDMLRYLQESREQAAEMIRVEVLKERQDTARKMRRYYLTCLQDLLEDGGKATGAEKKIISAASRLAAMARVLETPVKSKSGKNHSLPSLIAIPSTLTEHQEESHREETFPASNRKASEPPQQKASASQLDPAHMSVKSKSKSRAERRVNTEAQSHPLPTQEAPVRDRSPSDWSLSSSDSDSSVQVPRLSYPGKKVETVKPFSVCASASDIAEFGGLTPDSSDLTVYNEIAKMPKSLTFHSAKMSTHREPTPGSEAQREYRVGSRGPFSELRQRQRDSGFDSPFYQK